MTPIRHPQTTRTLGAPADWDEGLHGPCVGLPITDSGGVMYSYWRPTWPDRLRVLVGSPVRLSVVGKTHPPVMLDTERV